MTTSKTQLQAALDSLDRGNVEEAREHILAAMGTPDDQAHDLSGTKDPLRVAGAKPHARHA